MKIFASFDPGQDLIYISAKVFGSLGSINAHIALDTGAAFTLLRPDILLAAGYDLENTGQDASIVTGSGVESVKALVVDRILAIDETLENITVISHDLPEESGIDGVLGLNFLRNFDLEIRYSDHTISLKKLIH